MDGKAQHLVGQLLRYRQRPAVEGAEGRMLVEREAVEEAGANALLVEPGADAVAIGNPDRVERENALITIGDSWQNHSFAEGLRIAQGDLVAPRQLFAKDLQIVLVPTKKGHVTHPSEIQGKPSWPTLHFNHSEKLSRGSILILVEIYLVPYLNVKTQKHYALQKRINL